MTVRSWVRGLFARPVTRPIRLAPARRRPAVEALEDRWVPTIDLNVVLGGTLDVNPVSSIIPAGYDRMEVQATTVPGLSYGTMYKVSLTEAYPWGSGAPNPFAPAAAPSFNQNRINGGQGFRYVNDGTGLGETESIPVRFSNITGTVTTTDTLVIHINSASAAPTITTQPAGLTMAVSGQTATLNVVATGPGPLRYQWYSGITPNASNPIAGATSTTFTTPVLTVGGQYLYWVKVSNAGGVANSLNATVNVLEGTTTTTGSATVTYSRSSQTVPMEATVTRTVAQLFGIADGAVTFAAAGVSSAGNSGFTAVSPGVTKAAGVLTIPGRTHAGVYALSATYAGNIPLYLASSSDTNETLTILKADQTISGFGKIPARTYGGADFSIVGVSATSDPDAGGVTFTSLNPSVAIVTGTTVKIVGAGTAVIVASQAGNIDWNPAPNVEQTLVVHPAIPAVTVAGGPFTYDQNAHTATAAATGINGSPVVGTFTFTYNGSATPPVNAGTYTVVARFRSDDKNYSDAVSPAGTLVINRATPTVALSGGPFTYDGLPHPAGAAATGVAGGPVSGSFTLTYNGSATAPSLVGVYAVLATFTSADPNYTGATGTGTLVINPAPPTDIALSNVSVPENQPAGTPVGVFSTTDPESGDTFTYALVSGPGDADNASFTIDGSQLKTTASFDFEARPAYSVRVRSTDASGLSTEKAFTVAVTDVLDAPKLTVPAAQTAYEDVDKVLAGISVAGQAGRDLTVTLRVTRGTLTLATTAGLTVVGNGRLEVSLTGSAASLNAALAGLAYSGALNFGGADTLTIQVSDGGLSTDGQVAITVKSAAQQAADLRAQIEALRVAGRLSQEQAGALSASLSLTGASGDIGKVQGFLGQASALVQAGVLTQAEADALLAPGDVLLLSVTRGAASSGSGPRPGSNR